MKKLLCLLLACAAVLLPACSKERAEDGRWPAEIEGVTFTAPPGKVVSLSPSVTESLYMLGYGGRLAGVSNFCDIPDFAKKLPNCGDYLLPDLEKIRKLSPDILFSPAELSRHDRAALEEAGIQLVVVSQPETVEGILENCRLLVTAFEGAEKAGLRVEELQSFFEVTLEYVADGVAGSMEGNRAIYLRKLPFIMATGDSLEGALLSEMGFVNQAEDFTDWSYPSEEAEMLDPDYIFCDDSIDIEDLQKSEYYKATSAVTNQAVFQLRAEDFERRSPRLFFALEQLMKDAFPDGFEEDKPSFVIEMEPPPEPEKSWWEKLLDKF